jgi:hypothetical protein
MYSIAEQWAQLCRLCMLTRHAPDGVLLAEMASARGRK